MQQLPAAAGLELANWNWKVVHRFVWERFGLSLCRSSCLTYLRRLGFAFKRPKKRLLKADEEKREAFVAAYAALREEAVGSGAKIFFADEAHFRADAELRGRWVLRGEPALVNSSSPRYGEKASYYSAVCLETGEVEWMDLEGNSNSGTSAAFLDQLRQRHSGPLQVIWDNAPAHRGEAVREYLRGDFATRSMVERPMKVSTSVTNIVPEFCDRQRRDGSFREATMKIRPTAITWAPARSSRGPSPLA